MVTWYKHDIPKWMDGTEALSDAEYRVYHVICELIYLNEGPIIRHDRGIAGRCNQDVRRTKHAIASLVIKGKLTLTDGQLDNNRAATELHLVQVNRQSAAKGGRSTTHRPSNSLKTNGVDQAPLKEGLSLLEKTRLEKKDIDLSRSNVIAVANDPPTKYPVQKAFDNWNIAAEAWGLPIAKTLTNDRRTKLRARLKEHGIEGWNEALGIIENSEFLRGENNRAWRVDLNFMLQPSSFNKLLEGSYSTEGVMA